MKETQMKSVTTAEAPRISAIIITKDEASNIGDCIKTLEFCDEVVIVDDGSVDGTPDIAKDLGAVVISGGEWFGFGRQKQRALDAARGKWIFSIDADERVTNELRTEILTAVKLDMDRAYSVRRENYFLGKRMRYGGWSNDHVTRLAKRERCFFSREVVHEELLCEDAVEALQGGLLHFSYRCVEDVFEKHVRYAKLGAAKLRASNRSTATPLLRAIWTFARHYFIQLGFLDGRRGCLAAVSKSCETYWRFTLAKDWNDQCT